ncbi:MAG: ATP-dependent helicase HrpA [Verrucomicrobia bacterium]|nr:MAG: ATP-dependent helicase HrpA [Verrucomicrobiota bacterium]
MKLTYPAELPITSRRGEIVEALRRHQVIVVAGETGSGKTTQLPKMCLEAGLAERGKIGCTQPRRVAAMSISRRVASELDVVWGREVGCRMRFSDDTSRETVLKFMTDGILLAEIQGDRELRAYSAIIIDEAHERSLNIDFLLGHLKNLLVRRPELKLIITSATIDTGAFSAAFGDAPVIEVSGRTWPVEIRYEPPMDDDGEGGWLHGAIRAVEDAVTEPESGDVLVFLPTERDIRDALDVLTGRLGSGFEVLPLYGRMAGADQQRVFNPGVRRRVILATNIAETSLTLPRIRRVIDAGLARISRYQPRTRTRRLPVEPVAQSSANQRAGRAGRVEAGVCIRLYSEEDFLKRPLFAVPEIQRANLAEVILRMKAFRLGEVETFPFLNPPAGAAIRAGYGLLHELGALDEENQLLPAGRELARLPLDPVLGRMLLEARHERVLPELLVIAAGLSIPDPRERPDDAKEMAAAAHRAFGVPGSDFLSLLRMWMAAPPPGGSGNAFRKFCRVNFLSFTRMTEWRDLWRQLGDAVLDDDADPPAVREFPDKVRAEAIHRCVLAGLLGHIAKREERNVYKASGNREVQVFPGSVVHVRRERSAPGPKVVEGGKEKGPGQPAWIMAAEIVQTSQLFARTVAAIEPEWAIAVGPHLCEHRVSAPEWDEKGGRVTAQERVLMHGLELRRGRIDYGRVRPEEATEIFIREALIEGRADITHGFAAANRKLRDKLEMALSRARSGGVWQVAERLYDFYRARLTGISSVHDLNRYVRASGDGVLTAGEADLAAGKADDHHEKFPDSVTLGNTVLPVAYAYTPGEERDGVTVRVPAEAAEHLTTGQLQWMVPGLRAEIAGVLLRALPKVQRRAMEPLEAKIAAVAAGFDPGRSDFLSALAAFLTSHFGVKVAASDWPAGSLPDYLRPRVEVVDRQGGAVVTSRELGEIHAAVKGSSAGSDAWRVAAERWEKKGLVAWTIGDVPEWVAAGQAAGREVRAWPGLKRDGETVALVLFGGREEAVAATREGVRRLAELVMAKDVVWLRRELKSLTAAAAPAKKVASLQDALSAVSARLAVAEATGLPSPEQLQMHAAEHVMRQSLRLEPELPLERARFEAMVERARREWPVMVRRVIELTRAAFAKRAALLGGGVVFPGMEAELRRLLPADFPAQFPYERWPHLGRYLEALGMRAQKAKLQPGRDKERAALVDRYRDWLVHVPAEQQEEFRWLLEEYRVSVFAQELGTAVPVSEKRLDGYYRTAG